MVGKLYIEKYKWLLWFIACCYSCALWGQTYRGTVLEQDGKTPVTGVNVCLLSAKGLPVAWNYTDGKGAFSVTLPDGKQAESIRFSFLGYKKVSMQLTAFPPDGKVLLESEEFRLEEVKVTASRITEKHDTLVYSVAGFSQPQDRSIADVIAKMPGMEVKENGQISFNGKNINKFYIEGMDLMNDRYALASSNISKKRVKSVEVLQNHQPIELLRGKSFSEQAAINLVLEDDSKMNLAGSADLGVGANRNECLYNNRLLAMLFGKKHQNFSIYKNDNTGYDLFKEINPLTLSDLDKENIMESSLLSAVSTNSPDMDRLRYIFNKSHLVATNHLAQLAEKTTLRTQVSYFNDVSRQANFVETEYLFTDNPEEAQTLHEDNSLHERRNRLDASLDFELNRPTVYVKNRLEGTFDWLAANSQTVWDNRQRKLSSSPDRQFFSDVLDIKLPLSGDRYLSITSTNSYNLHPQGLSLYSDEWQHVDYSSFLTHTSASFRHKLFRLYANYQLGFRGAFQSLSSSIDGKDAIAKQHYERYMPYGGIGLQYDNRILHAEADVKMHLHSWQWEKADGKEHSTSLSPDAKLYLKYTLSGTSSVSLNYRYSEQLQELRQIYEGDLFTSYRTIVNNAQRPDADDTHSLSLRYQFSQPIKGLFFSLSALGNHTQKHAAYATSLLAGQNVLVRSKKVAKHTARMYLLNGRFSKSFSCWKSLLSLSGSYMKSADAQFCGDELQDYDLDTYSAEFSFSARPLSFFSFEWESSWQQTRMKSPLADSKTNQLKHRLNFAFPITQRLRLELDNTVHQSLETEECSWFTDFAASYTYKRMEFQLALNNLLGRSVYEREFISSIERNYYCYTLRPREVLAKVSFTF